MSGGTSRSTLAFSGLPPPFLAAMSKLFRMLDQDEDGWIRYEDIARRWHPCPPSLNANLPVNILANLRKVTTEGGLLSFERFCAGLKIAILRHEADKHRLAQSEDLPGSPRRIRSKNPRGTPDGSPESRPRTYSSGSSPRETSDVSDQSTPFSPINRTHSLPNLCDGSQPLQIARESSPAPSEPWSRKLGGPPKPPRDLRRMSSTSLNDEAPREQRRNPHRRREGHQRRHSLHGGGELSMAKRVTQWEEERLLVEEGLSIIHQAQELYDQRRKTVRGKLEGLAELRTAADPHTQDAAEEKHTLELQSLKDLNTRLRNMMAKGSKPVRTNPVVPSTEALTLAEAKISQLERQVQRLKDQNQELTREVGEKSNAITNLERDKSALIRQLFQARVAPMNKTSVTSLRGQPLTRAPSVISRDGSQQFGDDDESTIM